MEGNKNTALVTTSGSRRMGSGGATQGNWPLCEYGWGNEGQRRNEGAKLSEASTDSTASTGLTIQSILTLSNRFALHPRRVTRSHSSNQQKKNRNQADKDLF